MSDFCSQCSIAYPCRIKAEAAASPPTVPLFLYGAQAGFLHSITRDNKAGSDRNPPCACVITSRKRCKNAQDDSFKTDFVWLYSLHLLWIFPCKSRLPKYSQPNNKKNPVLIHAWTFAEPKEIHLFDGRRKCGTYYQKKTSREVFIHVSWTCMSKTKVFKYVHMDKNVWREWGQRRAPGFLGTFGPSRWSCATYGPNSVNRNNSVQK